MSTLPTFLVIGVAKAGTTSLYQHLKAHPEVFMSPKKEPNFFSYDGAEPEVDFRNPQWITNWEDYRALFEGVRDEKAVGEASPRYFHSAVAPARIKETLPAARLMALLRHPVERAHSHYMMMMNAGVLAYRPFEPLFREKARTVATWDQEPLACFGFRHSFYYENLRRYFDLFPRDRIKILLFEEYNADPRAVLADVFRFLDVDAGFVPDLEARYNPSHGMPKSPLLHKTVMRPNALKTIARKLVPGAVRKKATGFLFRRIRTRKSSLDEAVRREFMDVYREDVLKVQDLIGRDLSGWFG